MKSLIIKLCLFFISFVLLYSIVGFFVIKSDLTKQITNLYLKEGGYGNTMTKFKEMDNYKGNIDILFLGSSHTYRSFNTDFFKQQQLKTFNLGTSNQTMMNTFYVTKEYLSKNPAKIVVIDVFSQMLIDRYNTESAIDLICNTKLSSSLLKMTLKHNKVNIYNTFLFECNKRLLGNVLSSRKESLITHENIYHLGGFVESKKKKQQVYLSKLSETRLNLSERQLSYLEKIIALAQKNKSKVVLVHTPITKELKTKMRNYYINIFKIKEISKKYNTLLLDFNDGEYKWNSKIDFYDSEHLTQEGVNKFNPIFLKKMEENNYIHQ